MSVEIALLKWAFLGGPVPIPAEKPKPPQLTKVLYDNLWYELWSDAGYLGTYDADDLARLGDTPVTVVDWRENRVPLSPTSEHGSSPSAVSPWVRVGKSAWNRIRGGSR